MVAKNRKPWHHLPIPSCPRPASGPNERSHASLAHPKRSGIRNYAGKISSGLVADSKTDLQLFNEDGSPGPNLARVLAQMAAVEIGPYRIDRSLIEAAIKADAANGNNAGKNAGKNAGSR